MNYTVNTQYPTAHITKQKSRLKIYDEKTIFLKDKDNFEFELYNSKTSSVLCKIKLNGNYISNTGIVLRPGQRVFLERFLDTNNKFEFSTYEVDNTPQNRSAIDLNGDVSVEFYMEQSIVSNNTDYYTLRNYNLNNTFTYNTSNSLYTIGFSNTSGFYSNEINTNISSDFSRVENTSDSEPVETGRIEKGKSSSQSFLNVNESFSPYYFHVVNYKLLPISVKNKTSEDIRSYCPECGKKQKKENKFCPSCGTKL